MRKGLMIAGVSSLLMLGVVAAGCSPAADNTPGGNTGGTGAKQAVEGKDDFSFSPKTFTAKAGSVTVDFKNSGALEHTFTIDNPKVDIVAAGGATKSATFNATAGTYQFYCKVAGHKEGGMVGTLTVN